MELNIYAGKRILYKHDGQWLVGLLSRRKPNITAKGLYLFIVPKEFMELEDKDTPFVHDAEINDIFFEAQPVEDWMRQYHNLMTKEEYIAFIESEDFERNLEQAWVSDGEFYYYPISKYTKNWLEKQPFEYVVRGG